LRAQIGTIARNRRGLEQNRGRTIGAMLGRCFVLKHAFKLAARSLYHDGFFVKLPLSGPMRHATLFAANDPDRFGSFHKAPT
jgi:hypothetical protein